MATHPHHRGPTVPAISSRGLTRWSTVSGVTKLNQIIAVEKGIKSKAYAEVTDAHQRLQKSALLAGIARTYQPKDEEGEQYPP
jgi:hypothetical protein